jgi:hypothetical protein
MTPCGPRWYKVTFKRRKAEGDTLQALILALIQVGTGRDLGEAS